MTPKRVKQGFSGPSPTTSGTIWAVRHGRASARGRFGRSSVSEGPVSQREHLARARVKLNETHTGLYAMTIVEICVVLLLILLAGFFAMAEFSIVSSRRNRLEQLAAKGRSGARVAIKLAEQSTRFLAAVQVGTTLCTFEWRDTGRQARGVAQ